MRPAAWSYTSFSDYVNCPYSFYQKRVIKAVKEETSEQMLWGNQVHKAFEDYVGAGKPLPDMLLEHRGFLDALRSRDEKYTEKKVALNLRHQPCGFFDKDVWWRGILDYHYIEGNAAKVVDYKTGKRKPDYRQLEMFAVWIFAAYPHIEWVQVQFYWTQDKKWDERDIKRADVPQIWSGFVPDLKLYARSFKDDIWPKKQSGLCNGWCPVKDCENWKPKRNR